MWLLLKHLKLVIGRYRKSQWRSAYRSLHFQQMSILFRSAFYLAKQGRPFTDFKDLVALQVENGLDIPPSYCNCMFALLRYFG